MSPKDDPGCYFVASGFAAVLNFPLWKASAIAQSGFSVPGNAGVIAKYIEVMKPPYKGMIAVIGGMTWARGAIFYGSDSCKDMMVYHGFSNTTSTLFPPLIISTIVQIINQPIVRASITIQDPVSKYRNTLEAMRGIAQTKGLSGLWHGTSAGILKTVPKYCTAIAIKDTVETLLPKTDYPTHSEELARSAIKSITAGVAGAALTNPLDVLRNEMFKTDQGLLDTLRSLYKNEGSAFMSRGMSKNLIAVAIPIAVTIFTTDALVNAKRDNHLKASEQAV
mmetsp:Transcript_15024/g.19486  ORF Transcript_15024/g.19486 Transcript_15024/m.19486 type:complete len:279 (+) Transcript_15024:109-945(+)|eukprot:CAMPEP_0114358384 /NCGR_PEP_ID=MMETSP0101-20121206/22264_1 /TAXON_ID=38822 ORGANISM="Pteridomonas danica, Strain PT" /NCGR_SAMPLE_ID=MMETSP0101 /ASSEMBLY_ACC=CAM_ASM_000211 /LENGTH=278 /DNA_ID=CAMNT_0001501475 /DNA_START=41 /DNA_END=877 /DNA_ORIENTATION=+